MAGRLDWISDRRNLLALSIGRECAGSSRRLEKQVERLSKPIRSVRCVFPYQLNRELFFRLPFPAGLSHLLMVRSSVVKQVM